MSALVKVLGHVLDEVRFRSESVAKAVHDTVAEVEREAQELRDRVTALEASVARLAGASPVSRATTEQTPEADHA